MMRKKLIEQLKKHEGIRLKPYKCTAGKLTIGVGRNIEDRGISEDEAEYMLQNDIDICMHELSKNLPFFYDLPETAQIVLIDMCFNMGMPRLLKFKKTLRHIELGGYRNASFEMLDSAWAKQVGKRAVTLSNQLASCGEA